MLFGSRVKSPEKLNEPRGEVGCRKVKLTRGLISVPIFSVWAPRTRLRLSMIW